ncbi:MAG: methionyl-tRNA formyltransferase [Clostridiaceae bacterium]|nr:methionyl-tRNA formyltransferase [Clostridiaceae bacterium]
MGTPEFSVPTLLKLIEEYDVCAVFTQPDRPRGRGKKLVFSQVKEVAVQHNIRIFQPEKLKNDRETIEKLKELEPDFIIVVAFGQILPLEVLNIPKFCCINLHASLLPQNRGAAPINWAIINGDKVTGNTTMLMGESLDTGDMLLKEQIGITEEMTYGQLHDILSVSGAELVMDTIKKYISSDIIPEKQIHSNSTYAKMLNKEIALINWNTTAVEICNFIRGLNPKPTAYTIYENQTMKIYKAKPIEEKCKHVPGYITLVNKEGIKVETSLGMVLIKELQFPGGKILTVDDFLRGNAINEGVVLSSLFIK